MRQKARGMNLGPNLVSGHGGHSQGRGNGDIYGNGSGYANGNGGGHNVNTNGEGLPASSHSLEGIAK